MLRQFCFFFTLGAWLPIVVLWVAYGDAFPLRATVFPLALTVVTGALFVRSLVTSKATQESR